MTFKPFDVKLTREVRAYYDLLLPVGTLGKVLGFMGDNPEKPEGYFVEIKTLWNTREVTEILEVPLDGCKKIKVVETSNEDLVVV